jgi:hypothetical protein
MDIRESENYGKNLRKAKQRITEGYIPRVRVKIDSKAFDFSLIKYYIAYLESKGLNAIRRIYTPMRLKQVVNKPRWHA